MRHADLEFAGQILAEAIGMRAEGVARRRLARAVTEQAGGAEAAPAWLLGLRRRRDDLQALIDRVTVQETGFFREPQHFDALAAVLAERDGPGVMWSAGCANGQEAWSLAMALEEAGRADWTVVATDVSHAALARARAGSYSEREVRRLDPARRARFFTPAPDGHYVVADRLRRRVRVLHHNLVSGAPPLHATGCSIVFCRNVLLYLLPEHARRVLAMFAEAMAPDGVLFLGASEMLPARVPPFRAERAGEAFFLRREPEEPPHPPAEPPEPPRRATEPAAAEPDLPRRWPVSLPSAATATAVGEALSAAGLHSDAVTEFRRVAYLTPEDPVAHVRLALALEQAGEAEASRRAFRAARSALRTVKPTDAELGGFSEQELERLIDTRLATP